MHCSYLLHRDKFNSRARFASTPVCTCIVRVMSGVPHKVINIALRLEMICRISAEKWLGVTNQLERNYSNSSDISSISSNKSTNRQPVNELTEQSVYLYT